MNLIKETVNVRDNLVDGLGQAISLQSKIISSSSDDVEIDCSQFKFVTPLFVASMIVYLRGLDKKVKLANLTEYLTCIQFPDCLQADRLRQTLFLATMEGYVHKSYLPIIDFPASLMNVSIKDTLLSVFEDILSRQTGLTKNVSNGVKYFVSEIVDNITEHSESDRGLICVQSYPKKGYMDLCIADTGVTLLGSYKKSAYEIESDSEAMRAANSRISSKNLPNAENRGYGIYTSKKALIEGLNGSYLMASGNAVYMRNGQQESIAEFPASARLKGTVVSLRIPYVNNNFQIMNYIG